MQATLLMVLAVACMASAQVTGRYNVTTAINTTTTTSTTTTTTVKPSTTTTAKPSTTPITCPAPSPCWCSIYTLRHVKCTDQGLSRYSKSMYINKWHLHLVIERLDMSRNTINRLHQDFLYSMKGLDTVLVDRNQFYEALTNQASNSLKRLYMIKNVVKLDNTRRIGNFPRLEELNLSWNLVDKVSSDAFRYVPKLKILSLEKNHLVNIQDEAFKLLVNLLTLNLANNQIEDLNRQSFTGLQSLKTLIMEGNALEVLSDGLFADLQRLTLLDVSHNFIHVVSPRCFDGLRHLEILKLQGNKLTTLPGSVFKNTPVLGDLYIGHNLLKELEIETFADVSKSLVKLNVSNNLLNYVPCGFFQQLVALRSIAFAGHMTHRLPNITNMHHLREVDISESLIKSVYHCELRGLSISSLDWSNTLLHCDCNLLKMRQYFKSNDIKMNWDITGWCGAILDDPEMPENCTSDVFDDTEYAACRTTNPCLTSVFDNYNEMTTISSMTTAGELIDRSQVMCSRDHSTPTVEFTSVRAFNNYLNISWVLTNIPQTGAKKVTPTSYTVTWGDAATTDQVFVIKASAVSGAVETYQFARSDNEKSGFLCISAAAGDMQLTLKCLDMDIPLRGHGLVPVWASIIIGLAIVVVLTVIVLCLVWKYQNKQRHYHTEHNGRYGGASYSNDNQGLEFVNPNGITPTATDNMYYEEASK